MIPLIAEQFLDERADIAQRSRDGELGSVLEQRGRIMHTEDEVMLPIDIVNRLYADGYWPPPLAPLSYDEAEYRRTYPKYHKWRSSNLPSVDSDLRDLSQQTYGTGTEFQIRSLL